MNTFLPYANFDESARCLDRLRLGKQRVEVVQLLGALTGLTRGWSNHPAARMWRGYEQALAWYGMCVCNEWLLRGYRDTCFAKCCEHYVHGSEMPSWLGDETFHASHRSNLLRKDAVHYSQFGWQEPPTLPYVWPA